jgi:hypothetical protein
VNYLDARTRNLVCYFIFEVGTHLQVLSDADYQDFVERLPFVIWVEPTLDHLDGLAFNGSKNNKQEEAQKRRAKEQATSEIGEYHGVSSNVVLAFSRAVTSIRAETRALSILDMACPRD